MSFIVPLLFLINIFFIVLILVTILFIAQPLFSKVPFVPSRKKATKEIVGYFLLKPGDTLYDLGCGDSRILIEAARQYPDSTFIGYEQSPFPYLLSKLKLLFLRKKNIKIHFGNFFAVDLTSATHVFAYLYPEVVDELYKKLMKESRVGGTLFSLQFQISESTKIKSEKTIQLKNKDRLNSQLFEYKF